MAKRVKADCGANYSFALTHLTAIGLWVMAIGYHLGFARVHLCRVGKKEFRRVGGQGKTRANRIFSAPAPSKTSRAEGRPPGSPRRDCLVYRPRRPPVTGDVELPAPVSGFSSWYAAIAWSCSLERSSVRRLLSVLMSLIGMPTYLPPIPRNEPTSSTTTSTAPSLLRTRSLTLPMSRFCRS